MITRRGFLKFVGGSFLSLASLSAYAVGIEPMLLTHVKRYQLTPPHWPAGLKLRVVALADIHACRPWMTPERIASLVEGANVLQPDLIVLLGDYISGMSLLMHRMEAHEWATALSGLKAPLGVLSILGNHDWWHDPFAQQAGAGPTVARKGRHLGSGERRCASGKEWIRLLDRRTRRPAGPVTEQGRRPRQI
nr:metallophosphoesterase [Mesorhizobium sp. LNJC394B00]